MEGEESPCNLAVRGNNEKESAFERLTVLSGALSRRSAAIVYVLSCCLESDHA